MKREMVVKRRKNFNFQTVRGNFFKCMCVSSFIMLSSCHPHIYVSNPLLVYCNVELELYPCHIRVITVYNFVTLILIETDVRVVAMEVWGFNSIGKGPQLLKECLARI